MNALVNSLRLQSFRCLADTGAVPLRPLTVLVGRNGSGKSTFLRSLPLLRQSVEADTAGPIQWYGRYVDFGGFDETVSSFADRREIRMGFGLTLRRHRRPRPHPRRPAPYDLSRDSIPCDLTLALAPDQRDSAVTRLRSVTLEAAGHHISIELDGNAQLADIAINGAQPLRESHGSLDVGVRNILPWIRRSSRSRDSFDAAFRYPHSPRIATSELMRELCPTSTAKAPDEAVRNAVRDIPFGTSEEMVAHLRASRDRDVSWPLAVHEFDAADRRLTRIRDLAVANLVPSMLFDLDYALESFARAIRYAKPVRATAERYYRIQNLAVNEVNPKGDNLPEFLRSLTPEQYERFRKWTSEELGWQIVTKTHGGLISLHIREDTGGECNLADAGFGFSQILPFLAQLWWMQQPRVPSRARPGTTFAIEQPELHLHPGLQSKMADLLARSIRSAHAREIPLTVVVETHSEAMVNQIGQLVDDGLIAADDVAVALFGGDHPDSQFSVRKATFDERGYLVNWPFGFFEPV